MLPHEDNVLNKFRIWKDICVDRPIVIFRFAPVSEEDVIKIIHNLKPKSSCGFDEISVKLIKFAKNELCKPITVIVNQCLETGIFPDKLKIAKVIPLFKKGDPEQMDNYRPISILPAISKIIENTIFIQLYEYFNIKRPALQKPIRVSP